MRIKLFIQKQTALLVCMCCFVQAGWTQENTLSLKECHNEVQKNFPLVKGKELVKQSAALSIENLKRSRLPQVYANGKLSYQSEVTGISLPSIATPKAPKDRYSLNMDVEQLLYNAGKTKTRVNLEKITSDIEVQNIEVQMYQLRERVNDSYFSILLLRKSRKILKAKQKTIVARLKQVRSAVENGVVLAANQKLLESELLLIEQQLQELKASEQSAFGILSNLMGRELNCETGLEEYDTEENNAILSQDVKLRPEYKLYEHQKLALQEQIQLAKKDRYPLVLGFGQLGYGNPGYNQLEDKFESYYMLGAKISWKIFDWKESRRKQTKYGLQKDIVETHQLSFERNQQMELQTEDNNRKKIRILLQKDKAIVELQEAVSKSSASQLDNGVITSSAYLEDLNKEIQAKLNQEYHVIQLQQSVAEYERIKGVKQTKETIR